MHPDPPRADPEGSDRLLIPSLVVALVVGAWLRLDQLLAQVPADDEWHALRAVMKHDFGWILTHFGLADYSIPLALYDELLANTIGLEEVGLRLPMLACGLASIVVLPLLVRPIVGVRTAAGFGLLIATSPMLVYYSRYARPYAPATLAALVALVAAWRWREAGGTRWAAAYVVCAVLASWLLPVYAPLVLAPWLLLLVERLSRRRAALPPTRTIVLVGALIGLALLALLGPPLVNDAGSLTQKMSEGEAITSWTLHRTAYLFTGTGERVSRRVVLGAALLGSPVLARRAPLFGAYLVLVFSAQLIALLLANPSGLHGSITLARYMLPLLPVLLLTVAACLGELDRLPGRIGLPPAVPLSAAVACAILFVRGPLPGVLAKPNAFTNHAWHQYYYDPKSRQGLMNFWPRRMEMPPGFFSELAEREPGSVRLLEAPWYYSWHRVKMREAQALHRQHIAVGFVGRELNPGELPLGGEFRFRTFVEVADHAEVLRRGFDYVVFHNDLRHELKRNADLRPVSVDAHVDAYTARFGAPVYQDRRLTVFAVR